MAVTYSHLTTFDGSQVYTADGSPIVLAVYPELEVFCPGDIAIVTPVNTSKPVTWVPPSAAGGVPPYTFTVTPASGSTFAIGTTTVDVEVEDSFGNVATCSFTVTLTLMDAAGCLDQLPNGFQR